MVSAVGIESALTSSFKHLQSTDGNESTRKTLVIRHKAIAAKVVRALTRSMLSAV
jgi:hypothetical protein